MGRFSGENKSKIIDSHEAHDHLPLMVEQAIAFISKHSIKSVRREDKWNVPIVAVREAIVNAAL